MTDLELYRDTLGHPEVLNTAHNLAVKISGTDFVPKAFRGKPEAVLAALLTGREIGLGPMTALQRIHVIEGRAGLDAQGMRAQVLAHGHDIWIVESTPEKCTVAGHRRGSEHQQTVTWTMAQARTARLADKQVWKAYPRQMLQARATAELCRLIAPDALGGLAYSSEELEDERPTPTARRARQQPLEEPVGQVRVTTTSTVPAAEPAPSWDDDEPVEAEVVDDAQGPAEELATSKQIARISIEFNRLRWDDPTIDAYIRQLTSDRTDSRKAMTRDEASRAIDELQATDPPDRPAD